MNLKQYILLLINEESDEIAKAASKAIRFGLNEYNPMDSIKLTNTERIEKEFVDLIAILFIANILGINICNSIIDSALKSKYREQIIMRIQHVIKFMKTSIYEGQLELNLPDISKIDSQIHDKLNIT